MPLTLDIFNNDAFGVASLTAAINNPPEGQYVPTLLDSLFEEEGITTTSVMIERDGDALALVPATERLLDMARNLLYPLYASLATPTWLRMLGAQIGKEVEASTVLLLPSMTRVPR